LKQICSEIPEFMEEHQCARLVIGCREDLWSEVEPQLVQSDKTAVIGRFHPSSFDLSPDEALQVARPIFEQSLQRDYQELARKINDDSSHSAFGMNEVLEGLEEGRVQKLLLGEPSDEEFCECRQCSHLHAGARGSCVFCGSHKVHAVLAQTALIRKALLTDAEILLPSPGAPYANKETAAWLRF
jgi:hypothetical protein